MGKKARASLDFYLHVCPGEDCKEELSVLLSFSQLITGQSVTSIWYPDGNTVYCG